MGRNSICRLFLNWKDICVFQSQRGGRCVELICLRGCAHFFYSGGHKTIDRGGVDHRTMPVRRIQKHGRATGLFRLPTSGYLCLNLNLIEIIDGHSDGLLTCTSHKEKRVITRHRIVLQWGSNRNTSRRVTCLGFTRHL